MSSLGFDRPSRSRSGTGERATPGRGRLAAVTCRVSAIFFALALALPASAQPVEGPIEGPIEGPVEGPAEGGIEGSGGESEELDPGDVLEQGDTGATGKVVDVDADGAPLDGVEVTILRNGTPIRRIRTLEDGRYQVRLPPGTYTFKFLLEFYAPLEVDGIQVRPGRIEYEDDIPMSLDTSSLGEAAVTNYRIDTNTEAAQTRIRENAAVSEDRVSQEQISRTGDGSAGSAARRVVATQIVGGKYLFVRGLGGRYTSVTLNGAPIPQLDINSPGVELDLLPSFMLSSISVVKTYSPNLPGSFGGGAAVLRTREFPEEFTYELSVGTSLNSETTFRDGFPASGSPTDIFGFDRSTRRRLPSELRDVELRTTTEGFEALQESFSDDFEVNQQRTAWAPITSLSFSIGDSLKLRGGRTFGYYVAAGWDLDRQRREGAVGAYAIDTREGEAPLQAQQDFRRLSFEQEARTAAIATASLGFDENNSLTLTSLVNQIGESYFGFDIGFTNRTGDPRDLRGRYQWTERKFWFNQLEGQHFLGDAEVNYQIFFSLAERDQPNTFDFFYETRLDGSGAFPPGPWPEGSDFFWPGQTATAGRRLFLRLSGTDVGGSTSLKYDYNQAGEYIFEVGSAMSISRRRFDFRNFRYSSVGEAPLARTPPEVLFLNENRADNWELTERTGREASFDSRDDLFAIYGQTSLQLHPRIRFFGGVRIEAFRQFLLPGTGDIPFPARQTSIVERYDLSYLPAGAVTIKVYDDSEDDGDQLGRMNLRMGYSQTVARPRGPELSRTLRPDFINNQLIAGEPNIRIATIQNLDIRWEWFLGGTDVIAASVFAKIFDAPIEFVIRDQNQTVSFQNVESARNVGFELEAKMGRGRLTEVLEGFQAGANFTYVNSRAVLPDDLALIATNAERPLQYQAPFLVNASLGYDPDGSDFGVYLFYLVSGAFITQVGNNPIPDTRRLPFHNLDLLVAWDIAEEWGLKFRVRNLLNDRYEEVFEFRGARACFRCNDPGVDVSLSITYRNR